MLLIPKVYLHVLCFGSVSLVFLWKSASKLESGQFRRIGQLGGPRTLRGKPNLDPVLGAGIKFFGNSEYKNLDFYTLPPFGPLRSLSVSCVSRDSFDRRSAGRTPPLSFVPGDRLRNIWMTLTLAPFSPFPSLGRSPHNSFIPPFRRSRSFFYLNFRASGLEPGGESGNLIAPFQKIAVHVLF